MDIDVSLQAALLRRIDLQKRLEQAAHGHVASCSPARQLHREIRSYLIKASDRGLIVDSQALIYKHMLFVGPDRDGCFDIAIGTVRNFNRSKDLPHFTRPDGGWFDFQLQVREAKDRADILAYDFELRLPAGSGFDFVRFDLNPPGQSPQNDGLRSHLHLNADDDGLVAPAPLMSPFEILDLFLHGLRRSGRVRRSPPATIGSSPRW